MIRRSTSSSARARTAALLLTLCCSYSTTAQEGQTLRVSVSVVTVGVRVVDAKGREVTGLNANDFTLYEDGVVQQIALFSNEEQPLSLSLLLDKSDSMAKEDKLGRAKSAAQRLMDTSHRGSEYLYIPFDVSWPDADFTEERDLIKGAIEKTTLGHGTRLYDVVLAALVRCRRAKHARQAMIVITDGSDQHSSHTLNELISALQESQVQLYTVGYFSRLEDDVFLKSGSRVALSDYTMVDNPRIVFKRLAKESGAEAFFPRSDEDLQNAAEQISKDLRTQYTLAYYPSDPVPNARYRHIKVRLRPSGLTVRARQGYVLAGR